MTHALHELAFDVRILQLHTPDTVLTHFKFMLPASNFKQKNNLYHKKGNNTPMITNYKHCIFY